MKSKNQMASVTNHKSSAAVLYMAFELSSKQWVLAFSNGSRFSSHKIVAKDFVSLDRVMTISKSRLQLPSDCRVVSCYEAGRDAFWLHRRLSQVGIVNVVVDSSSIEVPRRRRRVKTDRLDAKSLVRMLIRYHGGEKDVWRVCKVPTAEQEDARRWHRERQRLLKERTQHRNRIHSLLATQGIRLSPGRHFLSLLARACGGDGQPVPAALQAELAREFERLQLVGQQLKLVERQMNEALSQPASRAQEMVAQLMLLRSLGRDTSWPLVHEFFGWRRFHNGKQVGSAAGLTGTPYLTGGGGPDQGISKAGNKRVRTLTIELAWRWLRYQPNSALSLWFAERFALGGKRARRRGIVAVARKLLIALWRYLEHGVVPEGAVLKDAC
jgi:transposase